MLDPTLRFSDRVENYVRYRPGYPREIVTVLERSAGLKKGSVIADIGSGTGKSCEPFLAAGYTVIGIEPNDDMRRAAEQLLADHASFRSIKGRAERTTLPDASVDWILAGQAFHWFNAADARREFARILRSDGGIALVWNERRDDGSIFEREYDAILKTRCPEYEKIRSLREFDEQSLAHFFAPRAVQSVVMDNHQSLDAEGLIGRVMSGSYAPASGPPHDALVADLRGLFARHQQADRVVIHYETRLFFSQGL